MYKVKLFETTWTHQDGEYKQLETNHLFKVASVTELMQLVGSMADASDGALKLSIEWEEE